MEHHVVLKVAATVLVPVILLFALYVQFHGDYGPGGGFQAGVIFGAGCILHGLVFGVESMERAVPIGWARGFAALGLLLYSGVGAVSLWHGERYLDYGVLADTPTGAQHLGIFLVELGVGITVTAVMLILFYAFSRPSAS